MLKIERNDLQNALIPNLESTSTHLPVNKKFKPLYLKK